MNNYVNTIGELEALFNNRHNLKDFHYFTNDEAIYDHFCAMVTADVGAIENLKNASNITGIELSKLNKKYNLDLKTAYLNGPTCDCGRTLNGYDFILNAIFRHGSKFLRNQKALYGAKFILPFRRAMDSVVCSDCGELLPLRRKTTYRDSSSTDSYGPCTTNK